MKNKFNIFLILTIISMLFVFVGCSNKIFDSPEEPNNVYDFSENKNIILDIYKEMSPPISTVAYDVSLDDIDFCKTNLGFCELGLIDQLTILESTSTNNLNESESQSNVKPFLLAIIQTSNRTDKKYIQTQLEEKAAINRWGMVQASDMASCIVEDKIFFCMMAPDLGKENCTANDFINCFKKYMKQYKVVSKK